jgi:hypothetical protein
MSAKKEAKRAATQQAAQQRIEAREWERTKERFAKEAAAFVAANPNWRQREVATRERDRLVAEYQQASPLRRAELAMQHPRTLFDGGP